MEKNSYLPDFFFFWRSTEQGKYNSPYPRTCLVDSRVATGTPYIKQYSLPLGTGGSFWGKLLVWQQVMMDIMILFGKIDDKWWKQPKMWNHRHKHRMTWMHDWQSLTARKTWPLSSSSTEHTQLVEALSYLALFSTLLPPRNYPQPYTTYTTDCGDFPAGVAVECSIASCTFWGGVGWRSTV